MSDFCHPAEHRKARKHYQCTYCAESINIGEQYVHQTGVYDGAWYVSKVHPECFQELCDEGEEEFMPYSNARPTPSEAA